jgi:hypothetical protein
MFATYDDHIRISSDSFDFRYPAVARTSFELSLPGSGQSPGSSQNQGGGSG